MNLATRLNRLETKIGDEDASPLLILDLGGMGTYTDVDISQLIDKSKRRAPALRILAWEGSIERSLAQLTEHWPGQRDAGSEGDAWHVPATAAAPRPIANAECGLG